MKAMDQTSDCLTFYQYSHKSPRSISTPMALFYSTIFFLYIIDFFTTLYFLSSAKWRKSGAL